MHQTRIDFTLTSPAPAFGLVPKTIFQIEDAAAFRSELDRIIKTTSKATDWASFNRIAINIQIQTQQPNISAANAALVDVIPQKYKVPITDEEDFALQINRPYVSSRVAGIRMNTITRWSVDRLRLLNLQIGPGNIMALQGANQASTFLDFDTASVSIDVNSNPTEKPILPTQQNDL